MKPMIFFLTTVAFVLCQSTEKIHTLNETVNGITELKVNIDFGMGDILLQSGDKDIAVSGFLQYNYKYTDADFTFNKYGKTGILDVGTDFDLDLSEDGKRNDQKGNDCELYLSPILPLDMSIDIGFGESSIYLDGLQIAEFVMDTGFGDSEIDFGELYNPISCERVDIDNGLGSTRVIHLANANTSNMDFECGLGSMTLDFSGDLNQDISVNLAVGLGSLTILVPYNTNVDFEYDGSFLSSIDLEDFDYLDDNEYRSQVYKKGKPVLTFSASVGAGSIHLDWIE